MRIEVTPDGCRFGHGPLTARRLRGSSPGVVRVALVATQALLLAGDRVEIDVDVRGPVELELVEPAGTVAYDMRGGAARWDVAVRLRDRARLTWLGEPFVVAAGASVMRSTRLDLDGGCVAVVRETLVLGRTGETGGDLLATTSVTHDGSPLLVESLDLTRAHRTGPAVLGAARCLDSLLVLGERLPDGLDVLQLDGPGSLARWIGADPHLSPLNAEALR